MANVPDASEISEESLEEQGAKAPFRGLQFGPSNRENIFLTVLFLRNNLRDIAKPEDDEFHFGLGKEGHGFRQLASLLSKAEPTLRRVTPGPLHSLYERVLSERRDLTNFLKREAGDGWIDTRFSEIAEELVAIADDIKARDNRRIAAKENKVAEQDVASRQSTFQMMHPLGSRLIQDDLKDDEQARLDAGEINDVILEQIDVVASSISNPSDVQAPSEDIAAPFILTPWKVPEYQVSATFFSSHSSSNTSRSCSTPKRKSTDDSDNSIRFNSLISKFEDYMEMNDKRQKIADAKIEGLQQELNTIRTLNMNLQVGIEDHLSKLHDRISSVSREVLQMSKTFNLQSGDCTARHTHLEAMIKNIQLDLRYNNVLSPSFQSQYSLITSIRPTSHQTLPILTTSSHDGPTPIALQQRSVE
ncbi:hypothetical protein FBU30_000282 [Linnemannia zychae]|nr:hypothetical protein FBU30_000282 [Linnemannia zychae]